MGHNGSPPTGYRTALAPTRDGARAIEASPSRTGHRRPDKAAAGIGRRVFGEWNKGPAQGVQDGHILPLAWPPHTTHPGLGLLEAGKSGEQDSGLAKGPTNGANARVAQPLPRGNPCVSRPLLQPGRPAYPARAQAFPTNHSHPGHPCGFQRKCMLRTLHYSVPSTS